MIPGAVVGLILFYSPVFQEHFFESGQGGLQQVYAGEFQDYGRFNLWSVAWNQAWDHPIIGGGVGSSFDFVPKVFDDEEEKYLHNDYLRIFFELGVVGLVLFVVALACQLRDLYRRINSSDGELRTAYAACWLAFCALVLTSYTDNTITHHLFFTNPLFAVLGAAYGVDWFERRRSADADNDPARTAATNRLRLVRPLAFPAAPAARRQ